MKLRTKVISLLAATAVTGTAVLSGCSLVATNTQADMEQVIATVDITLADDNGDSYLPDELQAYTEAITDTDIYKRDLVAYFVNVGYSYISDGSTTYGEAFEQIAEALVNNEILIQYSVMATLKDMVDSPDLTATEYSSASNIVSWFVDLVENDEVAAYTALLEYQADVLEEANGAKIDYASLCYYTLYKSINSSIDSYEEDFLDIDDDSDSSSANVPTNVDTEVDNYYPTDDGGALDYGVYTGFSGNLLSQSGAYQDDALEGTTMYSRAYSYNQYIQVLDANYLILDGEDTTDVYNLNYVKSQYIELLREQVVSNYYDIYELELEEEMSANNYAYVQNRYDELVAQQSAGFSNDTTFSSALSNMSASSFILYNPDSDGTFGYVYNILAPFTSLQSAQLTELSTLLENEVITQDEYYVARNNMLKNVTTTDQRTSWFNGGVDYSFDASDTDIYSGTYYASSGNSNHTTLFFKDNLTNNERYEELENYYGKYTFNGTAVLNADEETYTIVADNLDIDDLLGEFENYISWVLTDSGTNGSVKRTNDYSSTYYDTTSFTDGTYSNETDGVIDYSKFVYATGKVDLDETFDISDLTNVDSGYYKVMSAVNELQYAYTTDTSILSTYVGYSLAYTTEGSTGYVMEFEYGALEAVKDGVGAYYVVGTDYGWHIIYVTATLSAGETYTPDWSRVTTEGTFEYNFYELLKESDLANASSLFQQNLVVKLYNDTCVTIYEDRYEDLTSLTTTAS